MKKKKNQEEIQEDIRGVHVDIEDDEYPLKITQDSELDLWVHINLGHLYLDHPWLLTHEIGIQIDPCEPDRLFIRDFEA
jgi:hypothetical protein